MIRSFIKICLLSTVLMTHAAHAQTKGEEDPFAFKIVRPGDENMDCKSLYDEALLMRDIINTTQDIKDDSSLTEDGLTAIGAVGSFLVGSVTGGLGLAAAGLVASNEVDNTSDAANQTQDIAIARRSLMVGLYNGKDCDGRIDHVMQDSMPKEQSNIDVATIRQIEPSAGDITPDGFKTGSSFDLNE